ncbi:hypothetical protein, partial [Streptomyces prasinus]|uniref:hypothetical protein n=1 Tax=Streptomyces prasinus TaxID=67345 RepID=UPI001470356F
PSRTPSCSRTRPASSLPPPRPAHTPTLSSDAYRKLNPQSEYVSAMDHQATEPKVWFAGSTGI